MQEDGQGRSPKDQGLTPAGKSLPTYVMQEELVPASYMHEDEAEEEINLRDYLVIILRRRWTIAAVFTFCVLSALIFSLAATPMYKATALLQIQPGGPNIVSFDDVQRSATASQAYYDFFQTQYDILASRQLARRTIDKLGLGDNRYFNGKIEGSTAAARLKAWLASFVSGGSEENPARTEIRRRQGLVSKFTQHVTVSPRRKSFLVEVSFSSPDAETAARVAASIAHEYIDMTLDQRIDAASQGRDFIAKQLAITKARLEESEQQLQEFARGRDIYALEQEEEVIHDRLADLNERFTEEQSKRISLEALYKQMSGPEREALPLIMDDQLVESLKQKLTQAQAERAALVETFTPEYPQVRTLDARITRIRQSIGKEVDRLATSSKADYETAVEREALLQKQLDKQREVVAAYEEKAIDFKIMRRDVDTNRSIYENLLRRMKEVEVTEAIRTTNITLVDAPETPLAPASPRIPLNLALSMLVGMFGGVGLAFFQEYMDDTIKSPDDVERYLRIPTLGAVPEFRANGDASEKADTQSAELEVSLRPTSPGAEAIRTLRAALFLAAPGGLPSRLLVTSAKPNEGKTCIAANLAVALAQMGRKVVLIDCDLRRPRVHKVMAMEQSPGVTNYLTGNLSSMDIVRPSGHTGLDVVTSGPTPPNPVDLLNSGSMAELIKELEERYDYIVVDTPPALGFSDVPVLSSRLGGGCLLVTRSGETSRRVARQACEYMIRMQSKLLGVVLNRVATRGIGYSYYGYYGYYGKSYGDYYTSHTEDRPTTTGEDRLSV